MNKTVLFAVFFCLFCFCAANKVCAEDLSVSQRIEREYDNFMQKEEVAKNTNYIKLGWISFKKWCGNLPGIKSHNKSVSSSKNLKTENDSIVEEYTPYLQKSSTDTNMPGEDKKSGDNL